VAVTPGSIKRFESNLHFRLTELAIAFFLSEFEQERWEKNHRHPTPSLMGEWGQTILRAC